MKYWSASFYYLRISVLGKIIAETYRHFSLRVWLLSVLFITLFTIHHVLSVFFRLLDEIFHGGYRRVKIEQPVFIISSPRSGTTYLHRLLTLDRERFVYTKNAHTFFMSSSFVLFYQLCALLDARLLFGAMRKIIEKLDALFWGGWDDIHPMGFNKAEEDELVFAQTMMSGGLYIPFPYFHLHHEVKFLDKEPEAVRTAVMDFYESSLKRFVFRAGKNKTYLAKNVFSSARYKSLLERFPDARIIYIARHPYEAVPSMASMFTNMYGRGIPKNSAPCRAWAQYGIDFFKHGSEMIKTLPPSQLKVVHYQELLNNPQQTVLDVYRHFGWETSEAFLKELSTEGARSKSYKSAHSYSLETFGFSQDDIDRQLGDIIRDMDLK